QKTVIAHGMMTMGYIARMLTDWLPNPTHLKRLKVEFRGMVFPGDVVTCKGKVVDKHQKDGKNYVKLEVWAENQRGEKVAIGEAEVTLPSKR
ncbi:MAG: MaoC/PaaZ C-terminal domain-containing protein, partial [Candidatus Bathyarchaeota archaeon]|nr:MaoC/PaaZ C-terminal domain-containing protein [Candidatus Bathyarchaeota archaeon]